YRSKSPAWDISAERGGVQVFKSRDLKTWSEPVQVLEIPADNWATGTIWAPEMHEIDGRFYLFATVNDSITWKAPQNGRKFEQRGTQIFVADSPMGPFEALGEKLPVTPMGQMCLDGTFYRENGRNYMVYCHEWVEISDGTVEMIELDSELKAVSQPVRLFCGSAPAWSSGWLSGNDMCYVTDGVFLYKSPRSGNLYMIWSSMSGDNYALGVARSKTGLITGPWIQDPEPVFSRNGGHGMIFTDFNGDVKVALHHPNNPEGAERMRLFEIEEIGNTLRLK
ncbi:MAG: glycoside hydrolase family 43 protein, partial [Muribaculaceae bacterium]|nr:glycoside hydrolase family 43 protein [Muribaculaceae bacterium]